MNFPSGGTNESSPGRSFQRASLTQGWNTGSCIVRVIPADLEILVPPGAVRLSTKSGTPEIFAVNNTDPAARAEMGRPEGAKMTARFSIMSTYSSFEVCRTLALRQGIAGPLLRPAFALSCAARLFAGPRAGDDLLAISICRSVDRISAYPGSPTCVNSFPSKDETSTDSLKAFVSVLHTTPASHISPSNCATTS